MIVVPVFLCCTGCLDTVVEIYSEGGGFNFIRRMCDINRPSYQEEILGLAVFQDEDNAKIADMADCVGWDEKYEGY